MKIVTHRDGQSWCVLAPWYGEMRVVFTGDIFACIDYIGENS